MQRRDLLTVLAATAATGLSAATTPADQQHLDTPLPVGREMPSFDGAIGWLNSAPLTPLGLRGKVVLVEFWTYSCINWLRTLPYVRAWADKYKQHGLVVLGVHTPEFGFEKEVDNIRRAAQAMRIGYPIAIDSDSTVWRAFDNHYWPALYFFDATGRLRHHHFGEGSYAQSEAVLQRLLADAGATGLDMGGARVDPQGIEAEADWANLKSAETYVGYARGERLASPGGATRDRAHVYVPARRLKLDQWSLSGDWTIRAQSARLNGAGGRIAYRFHARDLHLVTGPAASNTPVRFRVLLDGVAPGPDHGLDIDESGMGVIAGPRLHQLIRQRSTVTDRTVEIEFLDPGAEAYSFTFG